MPEVRFAVDRMLGRLARWLRLLGYDATYGPQLGGPALLRHARAEQRIVLTRDHRLARRRTAVTLHLIGADAFRTQLCDVVTTFGLDPGARLLTRCSRCNHLLEPATATTVADLVPPYVLNTQGRFARCPSCRRIYWPATHDERIRAELRAMGLFREHGNPPAPSACTAT